MAGTSRFALTSLGTGLAVISANTFNHIIEAKLDLRMVRTSTRPLPSGTFDVFSRFVACVRTSCGLLLIHQPLPRPQDE